MFRGSAQAGPVPPVEFTWRMPGPAPLCLDGPQARPVPSLLKRDRLDLRAFGAAAEHVPAGSHQARYSQRAGAGGGRRPGLQGEEFADAQDPQYLAFKGPDVVPAFIAEQPR